MSDTASKDISHDRSGPTLHTILSTPPVSWTVSETTVVPDDSDAIKRVVVEWCDKKQLDLVVTTGGTGFATRDVTPEVCLRERCLVSFSFPFPFLFFFDIEFQKPWYIDDWNGQTLKCL